MSLYNAIFRKNPLSKILLGLIGLTEKDFYRFRDCYLNEDGNISVYTRGGGGNRECFCGEYSKDECTVIDSDNNRHTPGCVCLFHAANQLHPNYLNDFNDDFDNTYASFIFSIPESGKYVIDVFKEANVGNRNPEKMWKVLFEKLDKCDKNDPYVKRATEIGKTLIDEIKERMEK